MAWSSSVRPRSHAGYARSRTHAHVDVGAAVFPRHWPASYHQMDSFLASCQSMMARRMVEARHWRGKRWRRAEVHHARKFFERWKRRRRLCALLRVIERTHVCMQWRKMGFSRHVAAVVTPYAGCSFEGWCADGVLRQTRRCARSGWGVRYGKYSFDLRFANWLFLRLSRALQHWSQLRMREAFGRWAENALIMRDAGGCMPQSKGSNCGVAGSGGARRRSGVQRPWLTESYGWALRWRVY